MRFSGYRFWIALIVACYCAGSIVWAGNSAEWVFAGYRIHNYAGPPKTYNKIPSEYGYIWLQKDKNYSASKKAFKSEIKAANEGACVDFYFASPSSYNYVAIYKIRDAKIRDAVGTWKGHDIEVTKYRIYKGKSKAQIQQKAAANRKEWKYLSTTPVEWIDLGSDRRLESVSEVLTRKARNAAGRDTQAGACDAAIAMASRAVARECEVSKQGELVNLTHNQRKTTEYEIPTEQNRSVKRVQRCGSCEHSTRSGEWYCEAKVTVRCNHTAAVADTSLVNQLRGAVQGTPYTETDNPCVEDANTSACFEYRKWLRLNRSQGTRD